MTIPASAIVNVTPNVLSAGGNGLDVIGLLLTTSTRPPIGQVLSFGNPADVATYFGAGSTEASMATVYFNGFDNSNIKPGSILFAQYNSAAVSAYLRGGNVGAAGLTALTSITPGTLTITFNGAGLTSSSIDLSAATSFSDAASIIEGAFTTPPFAVTYDSISGAFIFTSTATGASATIVYPTDTIATALKLTAATGAVLSQGADAASPGTFMDGIVQVTQDWVTFTTLFNPDVSGNANKVAFAAWTNDQNDRYAYIGWDNDSAPAEGTATGSFGYIVTKTDNYSGTCPVWCPDATKAVFVCGAAASIDFTQTNGRVTFDFKGHSGLVADVTDETTGNNLMGNGYNFYGDYATANEPFLFFNPGSISGPFLWLDSYINAIWLNNNFQLALMELLTTVTSIPYDQAGYSLIEAALGDPIGSGLNFGAFRAGVTLSMAQAAEVNSAAGVQISDTLQTQGWYLQVKDPGASVRATRGSPDCTFWYMDGEAIQKINLTSVDVQ